LNASSLVAHSMLFSCAAKQHKVEQRDHYTEIINGLISRLVNGKEASSIHSVIEIRELMEARLLLQAMGYNILEMNLVTRYGGLFYQYHVIDTQTAKVTTRYFSNLHFMKNLLLTNPDVSDDTASQLMRKYYQQQKLPFAITEQAKKYISRGQYQKATEVLQTLEEYSMSANVQFAQIYLNSGRSDPIPQLKRELNLDAKSGFVPAAIMLAQLKLNDENEQASLTNSQSTDSQLKTLLGRVDHFTAPGEGAFRLALALKRRKDQGPTSLKWFEQAVEQGHPKATLALAILYRQGNLVPGDDKKAFALFEKANGYGINEAAIELALYYHQGSESTPAAHDKEMALLYKMADKKDSAALYMLAQRFDNGVDVEQDQQQAYQWYLQAYDQGERKAANQIGILFETGKVAKTAERVGEVDHNQAYQWYEKAGQRGDSNGFSNLARFHHYGLGRAVDLPKAANFYVRAAETGSDVAYCKLADTMLEMEPKDGENWQDTLSRAEGLYQFGAKKEAKVCPRQLGQLYHLHMNDRQNAMRWFEIAARNGDIPALKKLERIYFDSYMRKDYRQAFEQFSKGNQMGMAKSSYFLGQLYHKGLGVTRDDSQALRLWQSLHQHGFAPAEQAIALLYLQGQDSVRDPKRASQMFDEIAGRSLADTLGVAEMFFYGRDTLNNYEFAHHYYQLAAEQGSGNAMNHLGESYRFGYGVAIDYAKALDWYQKADAINYDLAPHNIAEMYYDGKGMPQDYHHALIGFKKGAALGVSHSSYFIGLMYQNGQGTARDFRQANLWFYQAMDLRHDGAKFMLGQNMIEGKGMAKNPGKGLLFIVEAAEGGFDEAVEYLKALPDGLRP
ncbi:MAG: sel1 repeat family protein, partial [Psychrosphaera sp.]|nr:sel1 repeat family protein [Psychrosphaera sp.]